LNPVMRDFYEAQERMLDIREREERLRNGRR
jgi:hypothetical protein